jgi:adenylate kinase family enzyme
MSRAKQTAPDEFIVRPGDVHENPGIRGYLGPGGGRSAYLQPEAVFRGTTVQVCGLWPFSVGAGTPMVGVPLGRHLGTGAAVCADPIGWFQSGLISNPSLFLMGLPGLGKSTVARRLAVGSAGFGIQPLVLGDLKPDYVDLVRALGGQVITLGRGRGHLNVLDPGEATGAAVKLKAAGHEKEASEVLADAHSRRLTIVLALLTILRKTRPSDREESIVDRALRVLDDRLDSVPVLPDLLQVLRDAPESVRAAALDRGDMTRYLQVTEDLEASLIALVGGGSLGEMFAAPTAEPMKRDSPVVYDISAIGEDENDLAAAALLACWSAGFGTVNVANALADAGLEPRRHYLVILDELWRALRAGEGMVDRIDALTRLNRQRGVGQIMCTHTMSDLNSLATPEDRMKARGFVERAGMVICGGLPGREMDQLTQVVPMSKAEQELLKSWQNPPAWDSRRNVETAPPGRGKFLVKVGGRPGIPVQVELTATEMAINDTNKMWHEE